MNISDFHAKFFAYELTRQRPANDIDKFTASLQDAQVDLNPHQVDAALFAFKSPLSQGAILADEVGLGKTIEAGILLSQQWAERKSKLLIICPSNLRKQWSQELADKFFLPSTILEAKSFNASLKAGNKNPFEASQGVVICSYQFARQKAMLMGLVAWHLVIIDEAHRLRNVYKPQNIIGNAIKNALQNCKKVLLTATPLQNSLLELYGLVSIVDEYIFGDLKSFKSRYSTPLNKADFEELRSRLQPVCQRTLRKHVHEYINYTKRRAIREEYAPAEKEQQLYDAVSEYLQRPKLYALPSSQRQLMTLILRKLLASSTYAICATFDTMVNRLETKLAKELAVPLEDLAEDFEATEELQESWAGDEEENDENDLVASDDHVPEDELAAMLSEIEDLKQFRDMAQNIRSNTKANHLLTALNKGFEQMHQLGARQKALIFTESRRTQDYLLKTLEDNGYRGQIVLFNGSNADAASNTIYQQWARQHAGTDRITGSATADKRAALVDYFRDKATIMIATEAAAEGVNLQFCSLVVNYDMPWNPQRIEQRIGRCHRYGQKHDVVVVNFVNNKNAADLRVYELLEDKFNLFTGVFGASDEVLGALGNGLDFEKRIAQIYNECRDEESIKQAFDALQEELRTAIDERMQTVRTTLLENFDVAVRERLKVEFALTRDNLNAFEQKLWLLTRHVLQGQGSFNDADCSFTLRQNPYPEELIHTGPYMILRPSQGSAKKSDIPVPDDTNVYRVGHRLAKCVIAQAKQMPTPTAHLTIDYSAGQQKVTLLEPMLGQSGWLQAHLLTIAALNTEEHLLLAACTDGGTPLDEELARRLMSLPVQGEAGGASDGPAAALLAPHLQKARQQVMADNAQRNQDFFDEKIDKLDRWADDAKRGLEREIQDLDAELKLKKSEAKKLSRLEEKVAAQRSIKELEARRSQKRQALFAAQDQVEARKEELLTEVETLMSQQMTETPLFTLRWTLV